MFGCLEEGGVLEDRLGWVEYRWGGVAECVFGGMQGGERGLAFVGEGNVVGN